MRAYQCVLAAVAAIAVWLPATPAYGQSPPPNDNYLASTIILQSETTGMRPIGYSDTEDTTAATTQADLFNPDRSGLPFAGGGPEPLTCDGLHFGKTIWYDMHPKVDEGVDLQTSGYQNAIAVYEWSRTTSKIIRTVGCQASSSTQPNDFALPTELKRGKLYTVQVGGIQGAGGVASGLLSFTAAFYTDPDGDGVYDLLDKCPLLAGVRRFGGCPPKLGPVISYSYLAPAAGRLPISEFDVTSVPADARIEVRCSCGIDDVRRVGRHASSVTMRKFVGAGLPFGASIQIWATKHGAGRGDYRYGAIGAYRKLRVTSNGLVLLLKRCLLPGSKKPRTKCVGTRH